jgi:transcriptional regulator with XRE-family HTH domain
MPQKKGAPGLRWARKNAGLSQMQLAEHTGIAQGTLSDLEVGRRDAHPSTLRKLSAALGVPISMLLGEQLAQPKEQEVIDLAEEGFGGAQAAVAQAAPDERQQLVEQLVREERAPAFNAIVQWLDQPTETSWWFTSATVGRYAAVFRTADGDVLDLVNEINQLWREAVEGQRES